MLVNLYVPKYYLLKKLPIYFWDHFTMVSPGLIRNDSTLVWYYKWQITNVLQNLTACIFAIYKIYELFSSYNYT